MRHRLRTPDGSQLCRRRAPPSTRHRQPQRSSAGSPAVACTPQPASFTRSRGLPPPQDPRQSPLTKHRLAHPYQTTPRTPIAELNAAHQQGQNCDRLRSPERDDELYAAREVDYGCGASTCRRIVEAGTSHPPRSGRVDRPEVPLSQSRREASRKAAQ
jgi:hypothetical protein